MKSHHCLPLSIRHDDVRSSASQRGQSRFEIAFESLCTFLETLKLHTVAAHLRAALN